MVAAGVEDIAYQVEGSTVRGRLTLPRTVAPAPAVVWSHGYGAFGDVLGAAVVAEAIPATGVALLRVDHRGCGRSDPSPRGRCVQGYESVVDLVDAVSYLGTRPEVDPRRIFLMGESHGGAASLAAAALDQRVAGVLACDAFSHGRIWLRELWDDMRSGPEYAELRAAAYHAEERRVRGEAPGERAVPDIVPYAPADLAAFHQLCEEHPQWSRTASLATVESIARLQPASLGPDLRGRPVRLLHGRHDRTVPAWHADALAASAGTTDRHLLDAGHGLVNAVPARATELILEWLATVTDP